MAAVDMARAAEEMDAEEWKGRRERERDGTSKEEEDGRWTSSNGREAPTPTTGEGAGGDVRQKRARYAESVVVRHRFRCMKLVGVSTASV